MIKSRVIVITAILCAFGSAPVEAAATSHLNVSGTSINLDVGVLLPGSQSGCPLDTFLTLQAATSVVHVGGPPSSGAGASGFIQQVDTCTGAVAFGSFDAPLGSGFAAGPHGATLNGSIVVTMVELDPEFNVIGTVDKILTASALRLAAIQAESFVAKTHSRLTGPSFISISNGHSNESPASVSGGLTLDGADLLNDPTSGVSGSFQTGVQISMSITR